MYLRNILLGAALATTGAVAAQAESHMQTAATAQVAGNSNDISGNVSLNTTASGRTLVKIDVTGVPAGTCLLYTSPSPRDRTRSRMPSSA